MYSTIVVLLHVLPSLVPIFLESITRSVTDYHQVLYLMGAPLSGKITTGISRDKMKKVYCSKLQTSPSCLSPKLQWHCFVDYM